MEVAKEFAKRVLTHFGFDPDEIPVGTGRSADLRIADESATYQVEVKEKIESPDDAKERIEVLQTGEVFHEVAELSHDNRISGILRDAQKQLDKTPKDDPRTFQLIWFHASGIDADLKWRQAFATFYGDVVISARRPHEPGTIHCFYFDYSAAFAMPTIEALVLSERRGIQVCLNECSIRSAEFRQTQLFRTWHAANAIFDPVNLAEAGEIVFCRATIPRKCDNEIAQALHEQTGVLYTPIRMKRYSSAIAVRP
jgi:hypothetical protein